MRLEIVSSCGGVTALCANKRLLSRAPFFNFAFYCLTFNKCLGPTFRTYQFHQALKFHPSHENQRVWIRVVRGDINFGILRDPLNFLFLIDLYGPYLIEFLIENGSFLLTKAHLFGANWTSQPPTSEAFLAHFSLGKGT